MGYARMLALRLATSRAVPDVGTGGREVIEEASTLLTRICVTEAWPRNAVRARSLSLPGGVEMTWLLIPPLPTRALTQLPVRTSSLMGSPRTHHPAGQPSFIAFECAEGDWGFEL